MAPKITLPLSTLVVDDDEVSRKQVYNQLQETGVKNVQQASVGNDAVDALGREAFEFIVIDWFTPDFTGPILFNRIRSMEGMSSIPILILSGHLNEEDVRLIRERPCTDFLAKPFTKAALQTKVEHLFTERSWIVENGPTLDKLAQTCASDSSSSLQVLSRVFKDAPNPMPVAVSVAKRLMRARQYDAAEKVLKKVFSAEKNNVSALNCMGQILIKRGRFKESLSYLQSAHTLAPKNVARLCLIGEANLNMKNFKEAREAFKQALHIDEKDAKAKAGLTVASNVAELFASDPLAEVPRTFGSLMNTIGINLIRTGQYTKGVQQYKSALPFLSSDDDLAKLMYNLGLGYLRWGKDAAALSWLKKSESFGRNAFNKASHIIARIESKAPQVEMPAPASSEDLSGVALTSLEGEIPLAHGGLKAAEAKPAEPIDLKLSESELETV